MIFAIMKAFALLQLVWPLIVLLKYGIGYKEISELKNCSERIKGKKRKALGQKCIRELFNRRKWFWTEAAIMILIAVGAGIYGCAQAVDFKNNYYFSDNDEEKSIQEMFREDDTPKQEEPDEAEEKENKRYEDMLHYEWIDMDADSIDENTIREYGVKVLGLNHPAVLLYDLPMDSLSAEDREKVASYADTIKRINANGGGRTADESEQEYQAYWSSYNIRPVAEMAFQAGRAREDYYWNNYRVLDDDQKMKIVAEMMNAFDTFLQHDDRTVKADGEERTVSDDEILYRKGKVLYHYGRSLSLGRDKLHALLYAYGCFENINAVYLMEESTFGEVLHEKERWRIAGYYYSGLDVKELLFLEADNLSLYAYLSEEGIEKCEEAIDLCEKELGLEPGTLGGSTEQELLEYQKLLQGGKWELEPRMLIKILELRNKFAEAGVWVQAKLSESDLADGQAEDRVALVDVSSNDVTEVNGRLRYDEK